MPDGDSAALMHMGAFTMAGKTDVQNLMHVVLNNGAHESVGGQPSAGLLIDFTKIANGSGYQTVEGPVTTEQDLIKAIKTLDSAQKIVFYRCENSQRVKRCVTAAEHIS